jgi:hypothetical protein
MSELQDLIQLAEVTAEGLDHIDRTIAKLKIRLLVGVVIIYGTLLGGIMALSRSSFPGSDLIGKPLVQATGAFSVIIGVVTVVAVFAGAMRLSKLRVEKLVELNVYQDVESLIDDQQQRFSPDELSPIARATISIRLRRIGRSRYSS